MKYQKYPLLVTVQDKYKVREYAAAKGVKTVDLLYVTDQPEDIPFDDLPEQYMIKANHGSGWNILYYDSQFYRFGDGKYVLNKDGSFPTREFSDNEFLSRRILTQAEVIETCKKWLARKYSKVEWAYQDIPPKIVIEKLLETDTTQILLEYKIFTFYGVPKAIFLTSLLYRIAGNRIEVDHNFNLIPLTKNHLSRPNPLPKKPDNFSEILDVASKLGKDLDCARIDLYDTAAGITLGEITLYTDGGLPLTPTLCPFFNKWLGDQWILSKADTRKAIWLNIRYTLTAPVLAAIRSVRSKVKSYIRLISGKTKLVK